MTRCANQSPLASHQSAPAASLSSGSGGNISAAAIARAIREPVRVCEIDDGDGRTLIVEPLQYFKPRRHGGRMLVMKSPENTELLFHAVASGDQIHPSQPHKT